MVKSGRKPSKGRQRIEIRRIEDNSRRQVTCSKRKSGLFKKTSELHLLCGAHVAVVIFTQPEDRRGHAFAMGTPSVDHVLRRFAPLPGDEGRLPAAPEDADPVAEREAVEAAVRQTERTKTLVAAEEARMHAIGETVLRAVEASGRRFWWEVDVEALGEAELPEFARALRRLRDNVRRHADRLPPSAPPAAASVGLGQSSHYY